jgi:transaldolase
VYVKIPITDTKGHSTFGLIRRLTNLGVKVNVTAITTEEQALLAIEALKNGARSYISIFAGRIADTGRDPIPVMKSVLSHTLRTRIELIWASPREVLNVQQAVAIGCDIITVTPEILKKLDLFGKDLTQYSLETVKMFYDDAVASGLEL